MSDKRPVPTDPPGQVTEHDKKDAAESSSGYGKSGGHMGAGQSGGEGMGSEKPTDAEGLGSEKSHPKHKSESDSDDNPTATSDQTSQADS